MYKLNLYVEYLPQKKKNPHSMPKIPVVCSGCGYVLGQVYLWNWEKEVKFYLNSRCPRCHRLLQNPKPVIEIKNNGNGD